MAKFSGKIGFAISEVTTPGVHEDTITECNYTGDVLRDTRQWKERSEINANLLLANRISIVSDVFAKANIPAMKYVIYNEIRWTITSVEIQRPRLILTLGGVYNGPKPKTS